MPVSKKLQLQQRAIAQLTGIECKSQKAIYKAISNYEWNNEKDFSDNDLDRYPLLLEGNEYESDQLMVRWKVFKITNRSVMVVRTYMAWALDKYNSYSCGDGILYTMNPNHKGLNDLLQDLIDLDWYHKLHFPVKESKIMANKITLGLFHNPDTLIGYARVTIDANMIIHCRLYGGNTIRFKSLRKAQECLEKIVGHSLRFTTL
jgi:hypothetical protein